MSSVFVLDVWEYAGISHIYLEVKYEIFKQSRWKY